MAGQTYRLCVWRLGMTTNENRSASSCTGATVAGHLGGSTLKEMVRGGKGAETDRLDGPEWDSSDEDEPSTAVVVKKGGKVSKDIVNSKSKVANKKQRKDKKDPIIASNDKNEASSVVHIGHLPEGFEEPELRGFLGQFGIVKRLKVSRSRKFHRSRGYGFVEFDDPEVAQIVADTMSGYLMGQKRIVCNLVPIDKVTKSMFYDGKKQDWSEKHRQKVNSKKSGLQMKAITKRLLERERQKKEMLKEMGIDYDFPGYEASVKAFPVRDGETDKEEIDVAEQKDDEEMEEEDAKPSEQGSNSRRRKVSLDEDDKDGESTGKQKKNKRRKEANDSADDQIDDKQPPSGGERKKKKKGSKNKNVDETKKEESSQTTTPDKKTKTEKAGKSSGGKKRKLQVLSKESDPEPHEADGKDGPNDDPKSLKATGKQTPSTEVKKKKKKSKKRRITL